MSLGKAHGERGLRRTPVSGGRPGWSLRDKPH